MPDYPCPNCGGTLHVNEGTRFAWLFICHSCAPPTDDFEGRAHWLRDIARDVGAPDTRSFLKNPLLYLDDGQMIRRGGEESPRENRMALPDASRVDGWAEALWTGRAGTTNALRWLRNRGINERELRRWKIGWNGSELVLPLYEGGRPPVPGGPGGLAQDVHEKPELGMLVNLKRRAPIDGHKPMSWPGVDAFPLFADGGERTIVLCEGELDALAVRSAGIPATSVTIGEAGWREEWERALAGRRVAVCYDVGSERYAKAAVRRLRTRPSTTVGLLNLEGPRGYDLTEFIREHGSAALKRYIRPNTNWGRV